MNTHVNIVVILGLILMGFGSALILIAGETIYMELTVYSTFAGGEPSFNWNRLNQVEPIVWILLVFGFLFFVFGIGLLLKAKWTQQTATPLMIGAILGWTYIVLELFQNARRSNEFFIFLGIATVGYATFICLSLFLKNEKVLLAYTIDFEEYKNDDILDA